MPKSHTLHNILKKLCWNWNEIDCRWTETLLTESQIFNSVGKNSVLEVQSTPSCSDVTYAWDDDAAQLGRFLGVVVLKFVTTQWVSDRESTLSWNSDD